MLNKILAAEAYKSKLDQDPLIQGRLQLAKEQELAKITSHCGADGYIAKTNDGEVLRTKVQEALKLEKQALQPA